MTAAPAGRLLLCAALLAGPVAACAAAEDPLPVTIFYSREDPEWIAAERVVDIVTKKFGPRIRVEKVSVDEPAGYARLAKAEQELRLERTGDLTAVVGHYALTSKGKEQRDVETFLAAVLARLLEPPDKQTRRAADVQGFAREVFGAPEAAAEKTQEKVGAIYYRVRVGDKTLGWVADAQRTVQCPVCTDAHFLAAVSAPPELKILALRPVQELELYGLPLPQKKVDAFLRQFNGRTPERPLKVDAVTGATKTEQAYERAVTEILQELRSQAQKEK